MATFSSIGRYANVRYRGIVLRVTIIDAELMTGKPKRARVQTSGRLHGRVLMPGEYELLEYID